MGEHDDRGVHVKPHLLETLVRPGDDELVRARQPLARDQPGPGIDHGRAPAERARRAAELLRSVRRADDDESRPHSWDLREHLFAVELEDAARPLDVRKPLLPRAGAFQDGQPGVVAVLGQLAFEPLNENVDLAAAGQADAPGLVISDPVGQKPRLATGDDLFGLLGDVALDATAGNRAVQPARLEDDELRTYRSRSGTTSGDDGREGCAFFHTVSVTSGAFPRTSGTSRPVSSDGRAVMARAP